MLYPHDIFAQKDTIAIGKCLALSLKDDVIFPNWEFQTLTGVSLKHARKISCEWPAVDLENKTTWLTVHGVLASIAGYPHGASGTILTETGLSVDKIKHLLDRLPKNIG